MMQLINSKMSKMKNIIISFFNIIIIIISINNYFLIFIIYNWNVIKSN
jgi:hypothetical protein